MLHKIANSEFRRKLLPIREQFNDDDPFRMTQNVGGQEVFVPCPEPIHGKQPEGMVLETAPDGSRWWVCHWPGCYGKHLADDAGYPMGTPGDATTRRLRIDAHRLFDAIWKGPNRGMTRDQSYRWLAQVMEVPYEDAHLGKFDAEQLQKLILIIKNTHIPSYRRRQASEDDKGRINMLENVGNIKDGQILLEDVVTAANEFDAIGQHKVADKFDVLIIGMVKEAQAQQGNWFSRGWEGLQQLWKQVYQAAINANKGVGQAKQEADQVMRGIQKTRNVFQGTPGKPGTPPKPGLLGNLGVLNKTFDNAVQPQR